MELIKRLLSLVLAMFTMLSAGNLNGFLSCLRILPDTAKVGIDYISLDGQGKKIKDSDMEAYIDSANTSVSHPFIFASADDFAKIRNEYNSDSGDAYIKSSYSYALSLADKYLDTALIEYFIDGDDGILEVSREVLNRIITLAGAWQVTGEEKYALRAWQELENVCNFDNWYPDHFLDVAEMALAVSVGYDWMYDYLDDEQKAFLAMKVEKYAIEPAMSSKILSQNWWSWSKVNWNTVCYSGIGIACMTFGENFKSDAARLLSNAVQYMPIAFGVFNPDGVFVEGTGYWEYSTTYLVYFLSTARNFFGQDFGLSEVDGVDKVGYYPIYVTSPTGVFNYGDNKSQPLYSPTLNWFATEYDSALLTEYEKTADLSNEDNREATLAALWYNTKFTGQDVSWENEPLAALYKSNGHEDLAVMRSAYLDRNATFAAIKSGYNYTNHGDLDIGTFVFDSQGVRWAEELGPGDYNGPEYFVGLVGFGRWQCYRKRAEGQNTLVINPSLTPEDQYALAAVDIESFTQTASGGKAVIDMTNAYCLNNVKSVVRSFELFDNYSKLRITDKISCPKKSEAYWFMHTKAEIEILDGGKTAKLTIGDKQLRATLDNCDGIFTVMAAEPLVDTGYEYNRDNTGIRKLTVHLTDFNDALINIVLEPWVD